MGPEAAVNAVFFNKIMEISDPKERAEFVEQKRNEYREDVDIYKLAAEMVVDQMVTPNNLRNELIDRFSAYATKETTPVNKKHGVHPV
jgi:acetyl-CoA carboxylase carboxyltransferase component